MYRIACLLISLCMFACSPMVYTGGVPNFYQVRPGLWRSGQITTIEGWKYLKETTGAVHVHVIKLNYLNEGSDDIAKQLGYDVLEIPIQPQGDMDIFDDAINAFRGPSWTSVLFAVELMSMATPRDVWVVHCTHGQDRTGFVIGVYRVLKNGWTKDQAYAEMIKYHFHPELHGIHEAWERFDPNVIHY